jgi:AcrR family transcriptional regulator
MGKREGGDPVELIWNQPPPPPRQRALGREEVVAAAIALADEAGAAALTMKAVASRLGPYSPMAIYRYVVNKDGLVDLMLDAAAGEVPVPARPSGDWRADLAELAADTRKMIKKHGWYAQLVHTRPPAGPHMMRRVEFMLTVLAEEGVVAAQGMSYAALLDRHVFGSGLQEAAEAGMSSRYGLQDAETFRAGIATMHDLAAADGRLPHLTGWLARPSGPGPDEQFDLGLELLLDGISARLPGRKLPERKG